MTIRTAMLCDGCEAVFALDGPPTRNGLVTAAHAAGWTSNFTTGRWRNLCPDHTKETP